MKKTLLLIAISTILLVGCGKDNNPMGPSPVTYTPPPAPQASIPDPISTPTPAPPADEGDPWTIINRSEILGRLECRNQEPGWFVENGFDIKVKLLKNLDHEYRFVSNVFWNKEPGCQATTGASGESFWEREGKFMKAHFRVPEGKNCGRYQWDLHLQNQTTGENWPVWYGVLNTGNEDCAPPPREDPCVPDPIRNFKISKKIGPESVIVTVSYDIKGWGKIIWGDGEFTKVNGSGSSQHEYVRLTEDQEFTITMETLCDPVSEPVSIPKLPESGPTCDDIVTKLAISAQDQNKVRATWSVGPPPPPITSIRIDLDWGDGDSLSQPVPPAGSAGHEYDCPREGGTGFYTATLMATAGDLVCSETTSVEVECEPEVCQEKGEPECDDQEWDPISCTWVGECNQCEEAEVDVTYDSKNCSLGTVKYYATANMKGRFCVTGGGLSQSLLPEAQTALGSALFSLTPGNCVDDVDNVWIKVPEGSDFTVSFAGDDACEEWEDDFEAEECEEPQCSAEWDKSSYSASGSCSAQVCNTGDGSGLCPVAWELYFNADGPAKKGLPVASGSLSPLGDGCETLTVDNTASGNYQYKFYQHSGHPGKGELWAEECSK